MSNPTIEAKIRLPANLLEATDKAVNQGKAKSRDEFIMRAIRRELAALKRAEIDAALAEMARDPEYQAEVLQMEAEFATASWEAFKLAESQE
ncbi:MAG: ribbon-helix-helix domain-containing protein [Microcoleus sp.]